MKGQWLGNCNQSQDAFIVIDIDEVIDGFEGYATFREPSRLQTLQLYMAFKTKGKSLNHELICNVEPILAGRIIGDEEIKTLFPGMDIPKKAIFNINYSGDTLAISWTADIGEGGSADLPRSEADRPSNLNSIKMTWEGFKQHVFDLQERRYIFRGQERQWRLRTGFHRAGRANLERFLSHDIQALHKNLSARTRHFFNLLDPEQNGAFLNLIQHHGYPTPLLDWTYSPFVAAYFAFYNVGKLRADNAGEDDVVRIFILDKEECTRRLPPIPNLTKFGLHFSLHEFNSVENERLVPQQAISSASSVDDIENFLINGAGLNQSSSLYAIDICSKYRFKAMHDLRKFGLTTASLFPGLDGACKDLRDRLFDM